MSEPVPQGPMDVPLAVLRLAEAFIFASPEPVTYKALEPVLPGILTHSLFWRRCRSTAPTAA